MPARRARLKIIGPADAFRAMWRWLAMNSPTPVTFEPTLRRRSTIVIRLEPARGKRTTPHDFP